MSKFIYDDIRKSKFILNVLGAYDVDSYIRDHWLAEATDFNMEYPKRFITKMNIKTCCFNNKKKFRHEEEKCMSTYKIYNL